MEAIINNDFFFCKITKYFPLLVYLQPCYEILYSIALFAGTSLKFFVRRTIW